MSGGANTVSPRQAAEAASTGAPERRIGVYICHCGGNIADYVDVERVREAVACEPGVAVAKTAMFTCSDATQQEMVQDIQEQKLDGLVVASCSPKLHQFTFREVARRAGLNPYQYTQVNIREQCSWAHTDDRAGATEKAVRLVRAGVARTRLSLPLSPMVVTTVPRVLIVGAGVAGLRAAIGLADVGLEVLLVEKTGEPGGWVAGLGEMYPHGASGRDLVARLLAEVSRRPAITLLTKAELVEKTGSFGNFKVKVRVDHAAEAEATAGEAGGRPAKPASASGASTTVEAQVGAVIVATGFEAYQPRRGEYGYGLDGVLTLPEFEQLLGWQSRRGSASGIVFGGRRVKSIVYIYCVGSRQGGNARGSAAGCPDPAQGADELEGAGYGAATGDSPAGDSPIGDGPIGDSPAGECPAGECPAGDQQAPGGGNRYCSRYCCNAACHAAIRAGALDPEVRQYHLYRDVRTYGKFEALFTESREIGSVFARFDPADPPVVSAGGRTGEGNAGGRAGAAGGHTGAGSAGATGDGSRLSVSVKDLLTGGETLDIPADLVVLVTGMVPRRNEDLVRTLRLPIGKDGFYNEIHPKLRPVETVVDGVLVSGACQGPKNSAEAVTSALAAAAQGAAILKKGKAELEPLVAKISVDKCDGCGKCLEACPFGAIEWSGEPAGAGSGAGPGALVGTAAGAAESAGAVGASARSAVVNPAVCKGCGGCVPICPTGAIDLLGYTDDQVRAMIDALAREVA